MHIFKRLNFHLHMRHRGTLKKLYTGCSSANIYVSFGSGREKYVLLSPYQVLFVIQSSGNSCQMISFLIFWPHTASAASSLQDAIFNLKFSWILFIILSFSNRQIKWCKSSGPIIWAPKWPWWPHWPRWPHRPQWPQWPQWPLLSLWPQKIQKLLGIQVIRDFLTSATFLTSLASTASTASVASMKPKVFSLKKLVANSVFLMPGNKTTIFGWVYCQKPRIFHIFDTFLIWGCWGCVRSKN